MYFPRSPQTAVTWTPSGVYVYTCRGCTCIHVVDARSEGWVLTVAANQSDLATPCSRALKRPSTFVPTGKCCDSPEKYFHKSCGLLPSCSGDSASGVSWWLVDSPASGCLSWSSLLVPYPSISLPSSWNCPVVICCTSSSLRPSPCCNGLVAGCVGFDLWDALFLRRLAGTAGRCGTLDSTE